MTFTGDVGATLEALQSLFSDDVAVIGAQALGCFIDMKWRATADVDLAVACTLADVPKTLGRDDRWTADRRRPYRWTYSGATDVDILPVSTETVQRGYLEWPDGARMSVAGLELCFEHFEYRLANQTPVRVALPTVVAILKMRAYLDRPGERQRDLQDLAHLLDLYLPDDDPRRFEDASLSQLDWEEQSPYSLGLGIAAVSGANRPVSDEFLALLRDEAKPHHQVMANLGPASWLPDRSAALASRLEALANGFNS